MYVYPLLILLSSADSPPSSVAPHPEIQHILPSSNSSPKFGRQIGSTKPQKKQYFVKLAFYYNECKMGIKDHYKNSTKNLERTSPVTSHTGY